MADATPWGARRRASSSSAWPPPGGPAPSTVRRMTRSNWARYLPTRLTPSTTTSWTSQRSPRRTSARPPSPRGSSCEERARTRRGCPRRFADVADLHEPIHPPARDTGSSSSANSRELVCSARVRAAQWGPSACGRLGAPNLQDHPGHRGLQGAERVLLAHRHARIRRTTSSVYCCMSAWVTGGDRIGVGEQPQQHGGDARTPRRVTPARWHPDERQDTLHLALHPRDADASDGPRLLRDLCSTYSYSSCRLTMPSWLPSAAPCSPCTR